ncbi:MAG TPA: response regulator [Spirochaetota bacterium]|nr:response regulator [Spirochaetota bacterium]
MDKYKILIVEDESMVFLTLQLYLKNIGFQAITNISSGEEAIEYLKNNTPDIIMMDILLSGQINGIEAAKVILEEKKIPIIFMSGYSVKEHHDEIKNLNPIDFLMKPITINNLKKAIELAVNSLNK